MDVATGSWYQWWDYILFLSNLVYKKDAQEVHVFFYVFILQILSILQSETKVVFVVCYT